MYLLRKLMATMQAIKSDHSGRVFIVNVDGR